MCYIVVYYVIWIVHYEDWKDRVIKRFAFRSRNTGSIHGRFIRKTTSWCSRPRDEFHSMRLFWNVALKILCVVWEFGQSFRIILIVVALFKRLSSQWCIFSQKLRLWSALHSRNINHKLILSVEQTKICLCTLTNHPSRQVSLKLATEHC